MWKIIREILLYSVFIFFLMIVCYTNKDTSSFNYQTQIKSQFGVDSMKKELSFNTIQTVDDFWIWTQTYLPVAFNPNKWYQGSDLTLKNFLTDLSSYIIGDIIIRQSRIEKGTFFK